MKPEVESPYNRIYISYNRKGHRAFAVFLFLWIFNLQYGIRGLHDFFTLFFFHVCRFLRNKVNDSRNGGMVCQRRKNVRMGITVRYAGSIKQMKSFPGKDTSPISAVLFPFKRYGKSGCNGYKPDDERVSPMRSAMQ